MEISFSNIPITINKKLGRKLHNQLNHPVEIIKKHIYKYFDGLKDCQNKAVLYQFEKFDDLNHVVTIEDNFDKLLIPKDHPARSKSDTYYVDETHVLRTHTSAHQNELLSKGYQSFLVTGDVYRKDEIDARHYPVFHQMEMLSVLPDLDRNMQPVDPELELKSIICGLIEYLFPTCNFRFGKDYFPFTDPSYEVEVEYNGGWLEILGCGIVQPTILQNNELFGKKAIAFGIGLERLVMIFCKIPDIRMLWCTDELFLKQWQRGELVSYTPYSDLPSVTRDISFFLGYEVLVGSTNTDQSNDKSSAKSSIPKWIHENDFFEIARESTGDNLEQVKLIDTFYNKKKDKWSRTYRLTYSTSSPDDKNPSEFHKFVSILQQKFEDKVIQMSHLTLR